MLNQIKTYTQQAWQLELDQVCSLESVLIADIAQHFELTVEQCLFEILPLAERFSVASISHFHVGAIAVGLSGNAYFGANMEWSGVPLAMTVHAEQAALNHAWLAGEKGVSHLYVNESPCGHCRQFMNELTTADHLQVHIQGRSTQFLHQLLPQAFGPDDLGISNKWMAIQPHQWADDELSEEYQMLWQRSYAPYTKSPAMCTLTMQSGERYYGAYAENAAFNPSLSPILSALVMARLGNAKIENLARVALVESNSSHIRHRESVYALVQAIAPKAEWHYQTLS